MWTRPRITRPFIEAVVITVVVELLFIFFLSPVLTVIPNEDRGIAMGVLAAVIVLGWTEYRQRTTDGSAEGG